MFAFAAAGALLFAAALAYFAYFHLVVLGRDPGGAASSSAVIVNVALFSAFALHHSVFARSGVKRALARRIPPPLERSVYVWVASLGFMAVCFFWRPLPGIWWTASGLAAALCLSAQAVGVVLTLQSAARIDIWELAGVRQVMVRRRPAAPLEISGPYRWVRHPIYLGWVLIVFGAPAMTSGRLLWAVVSTAYLVVAIPFEERALVAEFGAEYAGFQKRVRWRLVPGLW